MKDPEALQPNEISQDEARSIANDVVAHLDPSTIPSDSMRIDYRMLKEKMREDPEEDFTQYELEKLVPLYKHWVRQARNN